MTWNATGASYEINSCSARLAPRTTGRAIKQHHSSKLERASLHQMHQDRTAERFCVHMCAGCCWTPLPPSKPRKPSSGRNRGTCVCMPTGHRRRLCGLACDFLGTRGFLLCAWTPAHLLTISGRRVELTVCLVWGALLASGIVAQELRKRRQKGRG